jgi:hypothetical protein
MRAGSAQALHREPAVCTTSGGVPGASYRRIDAALALFAARIAMLDKIANICSLRSGSFHDSVEWCQIAASRTSRHFASRCSKLGTRQV